VVAPDGKAAVAAGLGLVSMICLAALFSAILNLSTRRYARIVHAWSRAPGSTAPPIAPAILYSPRSGSAKLKGPRSAAWLADVIDLLVLANA
jgi:hypothetical protein